MEPSTQISLRDHFAGLVLQSTLSKFPLTDSKVSPQEYDRLKFGAVTGAYDIADAMLQQRARGIQHTQTATRSWGKEKDHLATLLEFIEAFQVDCLKKGDGCRHPLKEKGIPKGWAHSKTSKVSDVLLAIHQNILKMGKLMEEDELE